jgi:outer membrane receptor for ferrienterochelin and colicin
VSTPCFARACAVVVLSLAAARGACAQPAGASPQVSLDSLLNIRVDAASKYAQRIADAPASVTIVSADDIRRHGYRNIQEVLEVVRGFYVSNDRNFATLGTRGFSRPSDYNNRHLLLIDGHTLNDQTWSAAPLGSELPINLDAIERIEIIRGPGSALYGTNAMLAVINIVTKSADQLDGTSGSIRVGTHGMRELGLAYGRRIGAKGSIALSGLGFRSDGENLYFPELDAPETNGGVSREKDWERGIGGMGAVGWGSLTARGGYRSRSKGIPTGSFGSSLADPRSETVDETLWGELGLRQEFGGTTRVSLRAFGDRYRYRGIYAAGEPVPYDDGGGSTSIGAEALVTWDPSSRNRLTLGGETRHTSRADYYEKQADGTTTSDDSPFNLSALFAQHDLTFPGGFALTSGLRFDHQRAGPGAVTPRFALVHSGIDGLVVKAIFGEAFRAPSTAEAHLTTTYYTRNPELRAERIRSMELEVRRRMSPSLSLGGSIYHNLMRNLIDQVDDPATGVSFRNVASATAHGVEFEADFLPVTAFSLRTRYSWQITHDESGTRLTNSPEQVATVLLTGRLTRTLSLGGTLRHESSRRLLSGASTPAFTRADANLRFEPLTGSAWNRSRIEALSLRVTNLFDAHYFVPGSLEHVQAMLPQPHRALSLRLDIRF